MGNHPFFIEANACSKSSPIHLKTPWPPSWPERINGLAELASVAAPEMKILWGGGVTAEMIESLCREPQNKRILNQIHLGQAVRAEQSINGAVQSDLVRQVARQLGQWVAQ